MSPWMISCFQSFLWSDRDCSCSSYLKSLQNSNLITLKIEYYCHTNLRQLTKTSDKIIMQSTSIPECSLYFFFFYIEQVLLLPSEFCHYLPTTFHSITLTNRLGGSSTSRVQEDFLCSCYWLICASMLLPHHTQTSSATRYKANPTEYRRIIRNAVSAKDEHRPQPLALLKHSTYLRKWYIKKTKMATM